MAQRPIGELRREPELQQLLEAISSGGIVDVDELEQRDVELLQRYLGEDESVESLLDRLRGTDAIEQ